MPKLTPEQIAEILERKDRLIHSRGGYTSPSEIDITRLIASHKAQAKELEEALGRLRLADRLLSDVKIKDGCGEWEHGDMGRDAWCSDYKDYKLDAIGIERDHEIEAFKSQLAEKERHYNHIKAEWLELEMAATEGFDCLPSCDSHGHDENCGYSDGVTAIRLLRERLAEKERELEKSRLSNSYWNDLCAKEMENRNKDTRIKSLEDALRELRNSAASYMKYHAEKFYPNSANTFAEKSGLNPAIARADNTLHPTLRGRMSKPSPKSMSAMSDREWLEAIVDEQGEHGMHAIESKRARRIAAYIKALEGILGRILTGSEPIGIGKGKDPAYMVYSYEDWKHGDELLTDSDESTSTNSSQVDTKDHHASDEPFVPSQVARDLGWLGQARAEGEEDERQ